MMHTRERGGFPCDRIRSSFIFIIIYG